MPTQLFKVLPWEGGLNTSLDESQIPAHQLTVADNIQHDTRSTKKKRDGINSNWDSGSTNELSVICGFDFWYGNGLSRTQKKVTVMSDGTMYSYTSSGTRTTLTVAGTAWSGTLTSACMIAIGNILLIAVSGSTNVMKFWDGTNSVQDVPNNYINNTLTRASSGTTRTLVFKEAFVGANGSTVIVSQAGNQAYNGTYTVTGVSTTTVANDTITYTATGSLTESTVAETALRVGSNDVPKASILREYIGRVLCNDKANPDLLHYSPAGDYTIWKGLGDSGALPVVPGDGDPVGINGIFPSFKGVVFIGKQTKLYRIDGYTPEDFIVTKISDGIGVVSHNSITPIDQDDIYFCSERGIHSLQATQQYGDFASTFVSTDIQKTFNDNFNRSRLPNVWGAYDSQLNCATFSFSSTGAAYNDQLYVYHIPSKSWDRWTNTTSGTIPCQSIFVATDTDKKRLYIGTNTGRLCKTLNGTNYDIATDGTHNPLYFRATSGIIYPDGNQYTVKAFKRFILFYKPQNTYNITCNIQIDGQTVSDQNSLNYSDTSGLDLVGSTFIVGTSIVGYSLPMAAYVRQIDGHGHGCKIDIFTTGTDEAVEIQGFAIEYEEAGVSYATYTG